MSLLNPSSPSNPRLAITLAQLDLYLIVAFVHDCWSSCSIPTRVPGKLREDVYPKTSGVVGTDLTLSECA